jgi:hypothetical protein
MQSVGKAAMDMVQEVRRQFREIPGLLEGTGKAEYGKCVEISTRAALREMLAPGLITIITPILVGFIMGPEALGGYMAGVTVSGVMWAIFQSNAGGAWDNAKKSFEKGVEINGQMYYKGSEPHKAAVTGDTVGDPFKDTSGPSMNILIKLTCLVGLAIAPVLGGHTTSGTSSQSQFPDRTEEIKQMRGVPQPQSVEKQINATGSTVAPPSGVSGGGIVPGSAPTSSGEKLNSGDDLVRPRGDAPARPLNNRGGKEVKPLSPEEARKKMEGKNGQ